MIWYTRFLPLILMLVAIVIGLFYFKKQPWVLRIPLLMFCYNFLIDVTGNLMGHVNINNHWFYNIANFIGFEIWLLYFILLFKKHVFKNIAKIFFIILPLVFIYNSLFQTFLVFQTLTFVIGGVFVIICCILYYIFEFQKSNLDNIFYSPFYWIATGLLIYYICNVPFLGLLPWLLKNSSEFTNYYFYICVIGSSILLSIFNIKAALCLKKN